MKSLEEILENQQINSWVRHFVRSPLQVNKTHESDAELIPLAGDDSHLLAINIDTLSEEVEQGLYQEPWTMAWVTVMGSFSDLAAVGAQPLGFVISVSLDPWRDDDFRGEMARGFSAACQSLGVYILGGDINTARNISLTGCAFGLVPRDQRLLRKGCRAGDVLFLSGGAGNGNALGLRRLMRMPEESFPESLYRPLARIREGLLIRHYASCCMDSSDGLFITLDQLLRLNQLGFVVPAIWEKILAPEAYKFCQSNQIPYWFMASGIHGEFELVFTVPRESIDMFYQSAANIGFHPIELGIVQSKPGLELVLPSGKRSEIDMAPLRNLWADFKGDLGNLIQEYNAWGEKWEL